MKNTTKQIVRHFNHKHSRLLEQLIIEDKLKSDPSTTASAAQQTTNISAANFTQTLENSANNCFSTNQVLVIIAVTCFLNFAFIVLIMMCVQILGSTANEREMSEENGLLNEDREELFGEEGRSTNSWESNSKLHIASLPDNLFSRRIERRLLRNKMLNVYRGRERPSSRTYLFEPGLSLAQDEESDSDNTDAGYGHHELRNGWEVCGSEHSVARFEPREYGRYFHENTT